MELWRLIRKGGWLVVLYPDNRTRKLSYYLQFFNTVEMDATFCKGFYNHMNENLLIGLTKATPNNLRYHLKSLR